MASRGFDLDVPTTVAAGAALDVSRFRELTIQVQGSAWNATLRCQGRLRGGAWEDIGLAPITQANIGELENIAENIDEIRVNVSIHSAGSPAIRLHADLARS